MVVDINPVYYDVPWPYLAASIDIQLGQLEKAGTGLAGAVHQRAIEYQQRVTDIRRRLEIARKKIDQIAKAKQGIVVSIRFSAFVIILGKFLTLIYLQTF